MNFVILNGIRSTTIKGLLIQSLPPISKPLIRTQVEEIDGRDGDIVTPLGYASYDKEMSIGLHGDYDVDRVIEFFNSSGEVTFSNEIDKYYLYQIIEQIDFERLIRFKTATVTFHVQPFKYSNAEKGLMIENINGTSYPIVNSGNYISRPKLTIYGTGTINLYVNGTQILVVRMESDGHITIDSAQMDAYSDGVLKNRQVTGDYSKLVFPVGKSTLSWRGNVTGLEIEHFSRWI